VVSERLRIERVKIEKWGRASGLARDLPDNDFMVLLGGNETGKTSLATALAWLLAGPGGQKLLRLFGDDGDELSASLRGRLGSQQLEIKAKAKVPKARATGDAHENDRRFNATVGDTELTRVQLADRLGVRNFDSYRRFYWLEPLRVVKQPKLTDDLSLQNQFGAIDPIGWSEKLDATKQKKLGASEHNPPQRSALRLYQDRQKLDEKLSEIAAALDELPQVDDIWRQKLGTRDHICGQLDSLRLVSDAIEGGTLAEWKCRAQELDAVDSPSHSDREVYERRASVGEAIGRLEAEEEECSRLSRMLEQAVAKQRPVGRPAIAVIAAGCVVAFAVLWAWLDDWRQSGLLVAAGAGVIAAALRLRSWVRIPQVRQLRGQRDGAERSRQERLQEVHSFLPGVNNAAAARTALRSICERVENYGNAVSAEQTARHHVAQAMNHDAAALQRATEGDLASLPDEIGDLEEQLETLADGAPSIDKRIEGLQDQASQIRNLSNQAPDCQLQRGRMTTQMRNQIVQGLGYHLAAKLLHNVADAYRKKHQPRLFRETERLASEVAGWKEVTVDLQSRGDSRQSKGGNNEVLPFWVVDSDERHPVRRLSFGARSLLFLMLRLATVAERGKESGVRLPVILDDVLVGIDDERAERYIGLLSGFSKQHQVILLTCHRGTAELAERAGAAVVTMPPRPAS